MCRSTLGLLVGLAFGSCLGQSTLKAADRPLNLLVIMTDEHNFRTLGCYRALMPREQAYMWGDAVVATPHIDWIAKQGALCTSFYATTPVCSPSRAALVSGQYPHHTPIVSNNIPMNDDVVTFAEILRRRGYATGYAGKWHLDGAGKPQWAPKRKFGFDDNRYMFNRGHWKKLEDTPEGPRVAARQDGRPTYGVAGATKANFTTDFLCTKAIDFIQTHKDVPFCYMVSIPDPHGPDTVRAPYDTMYDKQTYVQPKSAQKPEKGLPSWGKKQQGNFNMSKYYGMVRCIDDNVGRILESLRAAQILDHTVVVFTADHGDLRGEHHRQNKGVPYEASTRVPFLIHCPTQIKPGTVVNQALSSVDFLPTVLKLMHIETAGREAGRDASLLLIHGKSPDDWQDAAFLRGTGRLEGWLAVVTDRFKLVYSPVDPPWLFDLERDPNEVTNFFEHSGYREVVQRLARSLREYGTAQRDPFIEVPRIKADLEWSISGKGPYAPPHAETRASDTRRKRPGRQARETSNN